MLHSFATANKKPATSLPSYTTYRGSGMPFSRLPTEIILEIMANTAIGDLDGVLGSINGLSVSSMVAEREDPHKFFRELVEDTDELLRSMRKTNTVLSGSRAVAFFYRYMCAKNSDWDFFADDSTLHVMEFAICLEKLGAVWDNDYDKTDYENAGLHVISGSIGQNRVQIIWRYGVTSIGQIMRFHSSIVQCFITGFCAVSLYHCLGKFNRSYLWTVTNPCRMYETIDTSEFVKKYEGRGIKYIEADPSCLDRIRSMRDELTRTVDFGPYLGERNEKDVEYFKEEMHAMRGFDWQEEWKYDASDGKITGYIDTEERDDWYTMMSYMADRADTGIDWYFDEIVRKDGIVSVKYTDGTQVESKWLTRFMSCDYGSQFFGWLGGYP